MRTLIFLLFATLPVLAADGYLTLALQMNQPIQFVRMANVGPYEVDNPTPPPEPGMVEISSRGQATGTNGFFEVRCLCRDLENFIYVWQITSYPVGSSLAASKAKFTPKSSVKFSPNFAQAITGRSKSLALVNGSPPPLPEAPKIRHKPKRFPITRR